MLALISLILCLYLIELVSCKQFHSIRGRHHDIVPLLVEPDKLRVVHLDFDAYVDEFENLTDAVGVLGPVQMGSHRFKCYPPKEDIPSEMRGYKAEWDIPEARELVYEAKMQWLVASKLSQISKGCIWYKLSEVPILGMVNNNTSSEVIDNIGESNVSLGEEGGRKEKIDDWRLSLCMGREILVYRAPRLLAQSGVSLFNLGHHSLKLDTAFINGSISQHYLNGYKGYSTEVQYHCGLDISDSPARIDSVNIGMTKSLITVAGPSFCDYTNRATVTSPLDRLISEGFAQCFNLTDDQWIFEYCHPDSLTQFRIHYTDKNLQAVFPPIFLLGKLYGQSQLLPETSAHFPLIRHLLMPTNKTDIKNASKQFTRLPLQIVTIPLHLLNGNGLHIWQREAGAKGLMLQLTGGSPCPEQPIGFREARIYFYCSASMTRSDTGSGGGPLPITIAEPRSCYYELLVEHPGVCAHPLLRPPFPEIPKSIVCLRDRNRLMNDSMSLPFNRLNNYEFGISPRAHNGLKEYIHTKPKGQGDAESQLAAEFNWMPHSAGIERALKSLSNSHINPITNPRSVEAIKSEDQLLGFFQNGRH